MNYQSRIDQARQQLKTVRNERDEAKACHAAMREAYIRSIGVLRSKITKLLKRGCDVGCYTRAIQDVSNCGDPTAFMPQQYVQKQAWMLQSLHKTDMYNHQIKVIESHSNTTVNHMMVEASVIEKEQKVLEYDLMMRVGEYLNDKLTMEMAYHSRLRDLKSKIRELQQRVIQEESENGKHSDDSVGTSKKESHKYSDDSVGTSETFNDSWSISYLQSEYPLTNPLSSFSRMLALH
ncbi:hypothetical protein MHU86_15826 [Fragilaria crotonensis]|nr:hypothetical protein MHU86_15826 [Fragilaria crotonensis]